MQVGMQWHVMSEIIQQRVWGELTTYLIAHCSLEFLDSSNTSASASQLARTQDVYHHA